MCLTIDIELTQQVMEWVLADGGSRILWKRFREEEGVLFSPYQDGFRWEPGWNTAQPPPCLEVAEAEGHHSLEKHPLVWHDRFFDGEAFYSYFDKSNLPPEFSLVPCRVYLEDIIGAGFVAPHARETVVVLSSKLYISYHDYEMGAKQVHENQEAHPDIGQIMGPQLQAAILQQVVQSAGRVGMLSPFQPLSTQLQPAVPRPKAISARSSALGGSSIGSVLGGIV